MSNPHDIKYSREHRVPELMNAMVRHLLMYKPSEEHVHDALLNFLILTQEEQRRKAEVQRRDRQLRIQKASNDATKQQTLEEDEELQRRRRSQEVRSRLQATNTKNSKSMEQYQKRMSMQNQQPRADPWKRGAPGLHRNRAQKDRSNPFHSAMAVPEDPMTIHKKLPPLHQQQRRNAPSPSPVRRRPSVSPEVERAGDPQLENAAVRLQALQRGRAGRASATATRNKQGQYPNQAEVQTLSFRAAIFGARSLPDLEVVDLSIVITVNGAVRKEVTITEDPGSLSWNCEFAFHRVSSNAIVSLQLWNGRSLVGRLRQLLGETRVPLPLGLSNGWRKLRYGRESDSELELHVVPLRVVSEGEKESLVVKLQALQRMRQVGTSLDAARVRHVLREKSAAATAVQNMLRSQLAEKLVAQYKSYVLYEAAILACQTTARMRLAQEVVNKARRHGAVRTIQSGERKRRAMTESARRRLDSRESAVGRIQSSERKRAARDEVQERRTSAQRINAVQRLQSSERQRQAKETVNERRQYSRSQSPVMEDAVRVLQSSQRSRVARDDVVGRRSRSQSPVHGVVKRLQSSERQRQAKEDVEDRKAAAGRDSAVRRMQSNERQRQAKADVEAQRSRSSSPVNVAVKRLQSSERQRQAKNEVENRKKSRESSPVEGRSHSPQEDAVRRIQTTERKRRAEEEIEHRRQSQSPVKGAVRQIQSSERQSQAEDEVAEKRTVSGQRAQSAGKR